MTEANVQHGQTEFLVSSNFVSTDENKTRLLEAIKHLIQTSEKP